MGISYHQGTPTWLEGIVTEITGPLSYKIKLDNGSIICHHVGHVCIHHSSSSQQDSSTELAFYDSFMLPPHQPTNSPPSDSCEPPT